MNQTRKIKGKMSAGSFMQRYFIFAIWVFLIVLYTVLLPKSFPTWLNVTTMLSSKAVMLVLSLALMVPMIANDYDMSVGALMTFSAMMTAVMNVWWGVPIWVAVALVIIIGALIGAINGFLCAVVELDPFVITMGMQTLLAGIVLLISDAMTITGLDQALKNAVYTGRLFGISYVFYYAIILAAILFYFFTFTAAGRKILIVGSNRNVARLSGINVKKVRFLCFVASGALSGFAGVLYAGMLGAADPTSGLSYLMPSFAAVFLSTTMIVPGQFNPWGCVVAVYFLVTGTTGLSLMGISAAVQNVFYGAALIVAVACSVLVKRSQGKSELKAILAKEKEELASQKKAVE